MGKTNKAQRTKGNTKPSSSGHSAQLLSLSGRTINGFIGFDGLEKDKASYVPVTGQQISDSCDSCVDSDFRMVMRKMLKRDAVTRLKAMQEFGDYCDEKDADSVKNVLPFWPRLFNRLALDTDRRIREATHQANGKLVSKVKREIAPYLKSIMGVWLLGQCDLYAPAATAAQTTFSTTFPSAKQSDAFTHCKSEIFSYYKDNLFEQTAKSMSEPNSTTPEDMENKYILVISGTFRAIKLLLTTICVNDHSNIREDVCSLIAEKKFWKFSKSKEAEIRGSWYALISTICQNMHSVFAEMENKLATTVLGCLSDSDPVVAPSIWEAALSIVVNFENCWQAININKVVLPQLWSLLEGGGKGNSQVIFPCLLPFLSKLPKEIVDEEIFLGRFFSSLSNSLFLENVKVSHSECDAVLTTFMECLQYICCVRLDVAIGSVLLETILLKEVMPAVKSSLYSRKSHLAASKLYPLLGSLIRKIEYKCLGKKTHEAFSKTLIAFWENLLPITCKVFTLKGEKKIESILYLSYFYNSLLVPTDGLIKSAKVRFEDDEENVTDSSNENHPMAKKTVEPFSELLSNKNSKSFAYIVKFSKLLCENISEDCDLYYLNLLVEILGSALTEELFVELISGLTPVESDEELAITFFNKIVLKWIAKGENDIAKLNSIVELVFIICSNVSESTALRILTSCCEVKNSTLLQCLLSKGLMKFNDVALFQGWLQSPVFSTSVAIGLHEILKKIHENESVNSNDFKVHLNILHMCLTTKFEEKSLINAESLEAILVSLKDSAQKVLTLENECSSFHEGLGFICDAIMCIFKNTLAGWAFKSANDIVFLMFHHSLNSPDLSKTLTEVWVTAIESYISLKTEDAYEKNIILRLSSDLHSSILSLKTLDESSLVLNISLSFLSSVDKSFLLQKSDLLKSAPFGRYSWMLMDAILPTTGDWQELKEGLNLSTVPLLLRKKLFYPIVLEESSFPCKDKVQKLTLACHVASSLIINSLNTDNSRADRETRECYVIKHLPHILWTAAYCDVTRAANLPPWELSTSKIGQDCLKIIEFLPNTLSKIMTKMFESSVTYGHYWALPLQFLIQIYNEIQPQQISSLVENLDEKLPINGNPNKYVLQQIMTPYLSSEKHLPYLRTALVDISEIQDLSDKNFAGNLGEIGCYLQHCGNDLTVEMGKSLKDVLCKVTEYDVDNENLKFVLDLQASAVLSAITKSEHFALNEKILNYFMDIVTAFMHKRYSKDLQNPTVILELHQTCTIILALWNVAEIQGSRYKNMKISNFKEDIYKDLLSLYIYVANSFNQIKPLPEICENVLFSLSEIMNYIPAEFLVNVMDELSGIPGMDDNSILQSLTSSLTFGVRQIQFTSHDMLLRIMRSLPDIQLSSQKTQNDDDKEDDIEKVPISLSPLVKVLSFLTEIVESMLFDFKIDDLCTVLPETDAYVYTMAYLLTWIEMLEFISSSQSQVRSIYAADLEETKLLTQLFSNVFRLMPCDPIMCLKRGMNVDTPKKEDLKLLFIRPPNLKTDSASPEEIQTVASFVFATALRKVPVAIRTWWNNLDRKASDTVNKFTTKYISGLLCVEEIQAVHESEKQFENMTVQARPGSREVIATYTIDDCAIELSVQLPVNYPLGPISAERRGKIVIGQLEWRHWLMQLTTVLRYQNGSILDGLNIWKRNLDKKFEGVEECMICYYVLHSSTLKLPKLSCRVCKKKFHSACLYKWFDTSYNSTCPLCRHEFFIPMQKI